MFAAPLRLQAQIFNLGVQSNLIYRWNFLLRVLVSFVPLLGSVFLWQAVFNGQQAFAGYTFNSMVAYFITLILLDTLTVAERGRFPDRRGHPRRPHQHASAQAASTTASTAFISTQPRGIVHAAFAVVPLALRDDLAGPLLSTACRGWRICRWRMLATIGAALIQFFFCFTLAMIAFWILDIGSITFIIYSVEFLLGGHIFPVDALPGMAPDHLPAPALRLRDSTFPPPILIGHVHGTAALLTGFVWQWAWIGFFYVLERHPLETRAA